MAAIVALALIHLRGVGPGRVVGNVLAALKVSAFVLFIALGLHVRRRHRRRNLTQSRHRSAPDRLAAGADSGDVHLLGLERRVVRGGGDPRPWTQRAAARWRSAPARVIVIYLLLNALYLYVIPVGELGHGQRQRARRRRRSAARCRAPATSWASCRSSACWPSISAMTFAGPRVYFAMARDGVFFRRAARVHPRFRTPAASIVAQALWSSLLVLTGDGRRARQLHRLCDRAVCRDRGGRAVRAARARTGAERPFRAWGYPVAPAHLRRRQRRDPGQRALQRPGPTGAGVAIILAGVPLYFFFRAPVSDVVERLGAGLAAVIACGVTDVAASAHQGRYGLQQLAAIGDLAARRDPHVEVERLVARARRPRCGTSPSSSAAPGRCRRSRRPTPA